MKVKKYILYLPVAALALALRRVTTFLTSIQTAVWTLRILRK